MTTISALYFPDLQPPASVAALTGLLSPLRCYRLESAALAEQIDLPRLGKLLAELEGRSGQDALLFGQGILAQLGEQRQESASELIGPLLGFPDDPAARREREILWRALLLLKLAEIQGRREEELNADLQSFEARRSALFRQLRGEEEAEEDEGGATTAAAPTPEPIINLRPPERNSALLLKAWGQLFLRDLEEAELLLSADPAAVTILLETYTALTGRDPRNLGTLSLPITNELAPALRQAAELGDGQAAAELLANANKMDQEQRQQPADHPRRRLQFFLLPGTSLPELLAHLCRHPPGPPNESNRRTHGLLALLS